MKIKSGMFAGMPATLVRVDGDQVIVRVTMFGRETEQTLSRADVDLPATFDRDAWLEERVAAHRGQQERQWWSRRAAQELGDLHLEWAAWESWLSEQDSLETWSSRVEKESASWAEATPEAFGAWADEHLPIRKWPDHPLVNAAIENGHVTGSGTPKLTAEQWAEVNGPVRRGLERKERVQSERWERDYGHGTEQERTARRQACLDAVLARAPELRERFRAAYGLSLPDHALRFWALWQSRSRAEIKAFEFAGMSAGGFYDLFGDTVPTPQEGLDPRLHGRFYQAPANLILGAWGDSDGLHWGLWFDSDDDPSPAVAGFYARDGGGGFVASDTFCGLVIQRAEGLLDQRGGDEEERVRVRHRGHMLIELARWFEPEAVSSSTRSMGQETVDGFGLGPVAPEGVAADRLRAHDAWDTFRDDAQTTARWEAAAWKELKAGSPAFALLIGRDLHWLSLDDAVREARASALLIAAHTAMGNPALAEIARVHAESRDLPSVGIYG